MTGGGDAALAPSTSGRATYTVTGEGGQTFSISTPASFDMARQGGNGRNAQGDFQGGVHFIPR